MIEKTTARKSTLAAQKIRGIVRDMNRRAQEDQASGKLVAYTMAQSAPPEILRAMDIVPVWTENFAGLCSAKRQAEPYMVRAEAEGYSDVICGYARVGLGFDGLRHELGQIPEGAPDGGMPQPDLLLSSGFACDARYKWYQALGRYMQVPSYCIDYPAPPVHVDLGAIEDYYVSYLADQFRGLIAWLEDHAKRKIDLYKVDENFERSQEVFRLWYESDQLRKAVPCPMPSQDQFNIFVLPGFWPCEDVTVQFLRDLCAELKERVENGVGVIPDERFRLLWAGGLPPWHSMWIFNYFEDRGAVFVIERMYREWDPVEIPPRITDPVEKLAYRHFRRSTQRYEQAQQNTGYPHVEFILEYIRDYKIDGMVMHAAKSCRIHSFGQLYRRKLILDNADIRSLQLQSDMVDLRDFSEAQWKLRIDTFLEVLEFRGHHTYLP